MNSEDRLLEKLDILRITLILSIVFSILTGSLTNQNYNMRAALQFDFITIVFILITYIKKRGKKKMKYIKTNKGIWEIEKLTKKDYEWLQKGENKQSDNIEELFDGLIFKDTKANELYIVDENSGISLLGAVLFNETLRGFIETDKGLIYKAKLNEKGDWELL